MADVTSELEQAKRAKLQEIYLTLQNLEEAAVLLGDLGIEGAADLHYLDQEDVAALSRHLKKVPAARLYELLGFATY